MNGHKTSYADIAKKDLLAVKEMLRAGLYNHSARLCQQYVEKIFKTCIAQHSSDETDIALLHTHKLARLAERCGALHKIVFSRLEMAFFRELTDYYFDTNYPGDDYIELSEAEAIQTYDEVLRFQKLYEATLCSKIILSEDEAL